MEPKRSPARTALLWIGSGVGAAGLLWLASWRIQLWPTTWSLPRPDLLVAASILVVPYAVTRALRLRYALDPLVAEASDGALTRLPRTQLYGSGFVSFLVLLLLPFKLGELSRPLLLARARVPGVGVPEALSGVAAERIGDGLVICAMLFGGLAFAEGDVATVHHAGRAFGVAFGAALAVLLVAARNPGAAGALAARLVRPLGAHLAGAAEAVVRRGAEAVLPLTRLRRAGPFLLWTLAYWGLTVLQLWLVLRACGLELGPAAAASIVAIVGLSIQLPGGPAQTGSYQVGTGLALGLYLDPAALAGAGSSFAAVMYLLSVGGSVVMAVPGLWLMGRGGAGDVGAADSAESTPP